MARLITICIGCILVCLLSAGLGYAAIDPDTILGAWLLDEGSGDATVDASGNGNDGTLMNAPTWVSGPFGGALQFDGSSSYVTCGNAAALNVETFSVSFWCNIAGTQAWNHMISRGQHVASGTPGSVNWGVMMYSGQETILFETFNDTGWVGISTGTSAGEWHHVVATYDGSTMQLYHDGELGASTSGAGLLLDEERDFIIGARSDAGSVGGFFDGSLDDVGYFDVVVTEEDVLSLMNQGLGEMVGGSLIAVDPQPANGQIDVPRDLTLSWKPGDFAATHNVYFSDEISAVSTGAAGALIGDGITAAEVDPGRLEFSRMYYWRVDEVNAAPDFAIHEGVIWSFTVEPLAYRIENITASTNGAVDADAPIENTINGSGLDENDQHSVDSPDMWLTTGSGAEPLYIQYEFDDLYRLHEMLVWNYNVQFEPVLGFGLKDVTVEYSENGTDWTVLGDVALAQAAAAPTYVANTTIDFGGAGARFVKLTVNSAWGVIGQFGLSEVRFLYTPVKAREPQPADGAANVAVDATLAWRAGRDAGSHDVYLGSDAAALELAQTVGAAGYDPGPLDLGATYYWRIDEVNASEAISLWEGPVWSFSTRAYRVIEDFESYDDEDNRIYQTWIDGYGVNDNGSTVGHLESPFAERTIVKSGRQSMPLFYDNTGAAMSEAALSLNQNWTTNGIQSLAIAFAGAAGNTGQLYVKINGTKIAYDGATGDIARTTWQPWNIDLSTVGNVSSVTKLIVGIEGAGTEGVVYIDDIRLYPNVPELIIPVEPDAANLVALYALDGNANDSSGNGHDGAIVGDITFTNDPVRGQVVVLPGGDDQEIQVTGVGISGNMSRTIACWAKADNTSITDWSLIFGFTGTDAGEGGNGSHFNIGSLGTPGGVGAHVWGWEETIFSDEEALEWHHYAMSYDGTTIRYYGDGVPMDTDPGKSNVQDLSISSDRVHIGGRITHTNSFPGNVDDAVIYSVALTDGEIAYLAGRREPLHKEF